MRPRAVRLLAVTAVVVAVLAFPAHADDTATTFTLSGDPLAVSVPASASLGTAATGAASLTAQLGAVTVSDTRGALGEDWTATVSATDFATGGASADETIPTTTSPTGPVSGRPRLVPRCVCPARRRRSSPRA
jgi:hypothetical protein